MKNKDTKYLTWEEFESCKHFANKVFVVDGERKLVFEAETLRILLTTIQALCELSVQETPCELCNGEGFIECAINRSPNVRYQHYQHPPSDAGYQCCPKCGGKKKKYKTPADVLIEINDLHTIQNLRKEK